ncbi:CheY-like chemotaxis protein [Caulobacter ginsengisoli]|uniref:CheY-like chemotaxis protein n=1 Tax=Caulobacter ginsengisoli TaxID=400775 RepID=A0ABU0IXA4_9CAUL|nr:response regulator [Caulobacter ginsengisoli]MDQ0466629.1 CheY-like chemotaxis protein [Caulobacter ginsengisoli]
MSGSGSLEGLKILVVEDEMLVSMLVEDMLGDLGCTVVGPAASLEEALALAQDSEIDIALLDVNLAGKAIYPVADVLKARGVRYVFASGYGDPNTDGPHQGVPTLQKPFRMGDLEQVLRGLAR